MADRERQATWLRLHVGWLVRVASSNRSSEEVATRDCRNLSTESWSVAATIHGWKGPRPGHFSPSSVSGWLATWTQPADEVLTSRPIEVRNGSDSPVVTRWR